MMQDDILDFKTLSLDNLYMIRESLELALTGVWEGSDEELITKGYDLDKVSLEIIRRLSKEG